MATWKKVIVSGSDAELNSLSIDSSLLVSGSSTLSSSLQVIGDTTITGSLYQVGSNVEITTNNFLIQQSDNTDTVLITNGNLIIYDSSGIPSADFSTDRKLYDSSTNSSVDWENRQLIKSDGSTVSVDWENGIFSGSFSGSFEGDGSGLTGVGISFPLTQGTGITAFSFDGTASQTVSVSGSSALTTNYVTKWTGDAFANTTITDDGSLVTFTQDAIFQGDITVQGTASFQNTENLLVADRFVLFASGSSTAGDGGIVVQQGTQNIGELYGFDSAVERWGFTSSFDATATSYTPDAFVAAVIDIQQAGHADVARYQKNGNIKIDNGDIYIYS